MSYTYLPEPGAESSAECYSDMPQFALWKLNPTAEKSYSKGSETESCHDSRSGTTLKLSTGSLGADALTSCAVDSPAKTSAQQERERESAGNDLDCGPRWLGSFARFNRYTSSWKTRQCLLAGGLESFSETWPRWGMMLDGESFMVIMPDSLKIADASGLWPTVQRIDEDFCRMTIHSARLEGHQKHVTTELIRIHGKRFPLPCFGEAMNGFPIGWTKAGEPLEIAKFHKWLRSHSER